MTRALSVTDSDGGPAHHVRLGRSEGRVEHFNAAQYLAKYADLQAAFGSDLQAVFGTDLHAATVHFIVNGYSEGHTDQPL